MVLRALMISYKEKNEKVTMRIKHLRLLIIEIFKTVNNLKVNESRYKQCGVTPHFSTGQKLLKRILRKDKY